MIFKAVLFDSKKHYDLLVSWWEAQNFPPPPLEFLPPNGVIVVNAETKEPTYAAFLYLTDSPIAWVEFIVGNPFAYVSHKRGGLDFAIKFLEEMAKHVTRGKVKTLFTSTNNPALVNSLKKSNFEVGDKGMTQLIKMI